MSPEEASKSSSDELSRTSLTKKSINSLVLICAGNNYGSMAWLFEENRQRWSMISYRKIGRTCHGRRDKRHFRPRCRWGRCYSEACKDTQRHHQNMSSSNVWAELKCVTYGKSGRASDVRAPGLQRGGEGCEWEKWVCSPWKAGRGSSRGGSTLPSRFLDLLVIIFTICSFVLDTFVWTTRFHY
jgi:hypothetical protein